VNSKRNANGVAEPEAIDYDYAEAAVKQLRFVVVG